MALDDFAQEAEPWERFKQYNNPERDEMLENIADELMERFPKDFRLDFIEVSPNITKNRAWATKKPVDDGYVYFIRVAEHAAEEDTWLLRQTILHELVHIYLYQHSPDDSSDGSALFIWLCGAVGCGVNQIPKMSDKWREVAVDFIPEEDGLHPEE